MSPLGEEVNQIILYCLVHLVFPALNKMKPFTNMSALNRFNTENKELCCKFFLKHWKTVELKIKVLFLYSTKHMKNSLPLITERTAQFDFWIQIEIKAFTAFAPCKILLCKSPALLANVALSTALFLVLNLDPVLKPCPKVHQFPSQKSFSRRWRLLHKPGTVILHE